MAANSSPAILPTSNSQSASTAVDNQQSPSSSALRAFFSGISDTVRHGLSNRRPWSELCDRSSLAKPDSISEATGRIRKNYNYFRVNYLTVVTAVLVISLLTNPLSLIFLAGLLAAWLFLYLFRQPSDPPITLFGRQFSDRETLVVLIVSTIVVIFLTSVGAVLVSALMVGVAIVCAHAAFRVPEDLFLDEQEPQAGASNFLSFFTGGAPVMAQSPIATRA
ncbi:PRA1 family protein B4 [Sesamum indicum]|uniref:PRA1 family protein n=1 Tax=Sesamum indicum TaxID=4182 RepID=A0A6I9UKX7_SESIN|nr:PRA1 family protein B4 [Sesamum indicum]